MEPVTIKLLVWWYEMLHTGLTWSLKVIILLNWTKSQMTTVASPELVAMWIPLGLNSISLIQSLCSLALPYTIISPEGMAQIFQVVSSDPVAIKGFLGWIASAVTGIS